MVYFFLTLGIVASVVFVFNRRAEVSLKVVVMKGIASIFFVFTALFSCAYNPDCPTYLGICTVAGALMGMLGDIALDLKYAYHKDSTSYLKLGLVCFLIGHIFYFISILSVYGASLKNLCISVCFGAVLFAGVMLTEKLLKLNYGKFQIVTAVYIGVVGLTCGLGLSYALFEPSAHTVSFAVAMGFFLLSDALLAGLYFGISEKDRKNQIAITFNHIFYYAAQYLIATSLIFCRG